MLTRLARLRCNREKPCHNCSVRNEEASCKYEGLKKGTALSSHEHSLRQGVSVQQRINHLEGLVKRLMEQQHPCTPSRDITKSEPSTGDTTSDASDLAHSPGKTVIDGVHSIYKGADSWYDVLQEVSQFNSSPFVYYISLTILRQYISGSAI